MTSGIPRASLGDSIRFNKNVVVPTALQGALLRSRDRLGKVAMLRRGSLSSDFGNGLRRKYGKAVFIRFATDEVLLLLDPGEIQRVLDGSPEIFGHTATKVEKMGYFEPEAVTISPDASYPERRRFNEAVLSAGSLHPAASQIHEVVRQASRAAFETAEVVQWDKISILFEAITLRLIFGQPGERELKVRRLLTGLLSEANGSSVPERGAGYEEFRRLLEESITAASANSFAGRARDADAAIDPGAVPDQITHWLFAMNDTLAENAARSAGLISALDEVGERLSAELGAIDLDDAASVFHLTYLQGCIQEAMRLWPTSNFLMRTSKRDTELCGTPVPTGTTILIVNEINHLDPSLTDSEATRFDPERWARGSGPYHHFGGGGQSCPGQDLALLIAGGALATLHDLGPYRALKPVIESAGRLPRSYNPFEIELRRS